MKTYIILPEYAGTDKGSFLLLNLNSLEKMGDDHDVCLDTDHILLYRF
jgi:hypothetical protein